MREVSAPCAEHDKTARKRDKDKKKKKKRPPRKLGSILVIGYECSYPQTTSQFPNYVANKQSLIKQ